MKTACGVIKNQASNRQKKKKKAKKMWLLFTHSQEAFFNFSTSYSSLLLEAVLWKTYPPFSTPSISW